MKNCKTCIECKFYINESNEEYWGVCNNNNNTVRVISLVLNNTVTVHRYNCKTLRQADSIKAVIFNLCGKKGRWYVKRTG